MNTSGNNASSRGIYKLLIPMMWLAPAFTAFRYWQVRDQLPARMVTHFGANGQPNGWMSPQQSLTFSLVLLAFLLTLFTGILFFAAHRSRELDVNTWAMLALFYVIVGVVTVICDSVLQYNLSGRSIPLGAIGGVLFGSIFIFLVVFLRAQRGSELPSSAILSEEKHAARALATIFAIPIAAMVVGAVTVPILGVKLALGAAALAMIGSAAMAWDGFHYFFSPAGVEVRTLGFRLRSIPADQIRSYASDRWNALGGYGIRGLGNRRAYVWGNRGVRIRISDGEVFLGHSEPEKIVRDLDMITASVAANKF
jgi:Protein of unknown function (DUF1648)